MIYNWLVGHYICAFLFCAIIILGELIKFFFLYMYRKIMVRLIRTPRVIRTYAQRLEVIRLTEELKNLQPNPAVFKEDFVHLVNYIIKLHEKVQELI